MPAMLCFDQWRKGCSRKDMQAELLRMQRIKNEIYTSVSYANNYTKLHIIHAWLHGGKATYCKTHLSFRDSKTLTFAEKAVKIDGRIFQVLPQAHKYTHLKIRACSQILIFGTMLCKTMEKSFLQYLFEGFFILPFGSELNMVKKIFESKTTWNSLLTIDFRCIYFFPWYVRNDVNFCRMVIQLGKTLNLPGILWVPQEIRNDLDVARWALEQDTRTFRYLSYELRCNEDLLRQALLKGETKALLITSKELYSRMSIIRLAVVVISDPSDLPFEIRNDPLKILEAVKGAPEEIGQKLSEWFLGDPALDAIFKFGVQLMWPQKTGPLLDGSLTLDRLYKLCDHPRATKNDEQILVSDKFNLLRVKLEQLLKCPICFEIVGDSAKQCGRGHLLCNTCFEELMRHASVSIRCPICRYCGGFDETFHTSLLGSAVASIVHSESPKS